MTCAAAAAPGSQRASLPAIFFNRPGATATEKAAELQRCRTIIAAPMNMVDQKALTPPDNPGAFPRDAAQPSQSIETCMVMRGWRIYALSPHEREALARLSAGARARALHALTGADRPRRGRLVRDGTGLLLQDPAARRPSDAGR